MGTRFPKARFHVSTGPQSLFDRVRFKMKGKRTLRVHASHLAARVAERDAPLAEIVAFDASEWELVTVEVRADNGKFVTRLGSGRSMAGGGGWLSGWATQSKP